jgi:hypothetical protein
VYWNYSTDGTTWTPFTQLVGAWTADSSALATSRHREGLFLAYRGPGTV